MTRQDAISELSTYLLPEFDKKKRQDLIDYYLYCEFESDDPHIQDFSPELKTFIVLDQSNDNNVINYNNVIFDELIIHHIKSVFYGVKNSYILETLGKYDDKISHEIIIVGEPEALFPCPCCQYKTLEQLANYEICPVCFWEDEEIINAENFSMANRMTLEEARQHFMTIGACCVNNLKHVDKDAIDRYERLQ